MKKCLSFFLLLEILLNVCFVSADEVLPQTDSKIEKYEYTPIKDELFEPEKPKTTVQVAIKKEITTKTKPKEGDFIEFVTLDDVVFKNKLYKKGTIVKARIELVSQNKIMGIPSDLIVGNFSLEDVSLKGEISKKGAKRIYWLCPLVDIGIWFFGAGLLFIPIRGGHAKIKPKETFTLEFAD